MFENTRYVAALRLILERGTLPTISSSQRDRVVRIEYTQDATVARAALMPDHKCGGCDGDGRVACGEEAAPWSAWMAIPLASAGAVVAGLVYPVVCPGCKGTGVRRA